MEFLVFAKGQMQLEVPTYLLELAELEAARVWVAAAEVSKVMESSQLDLESGLVFWEAARVLRFEYPVHRLPLETDQQQHFMGVEGAKTQGEPALEPSPTRLMAYRDDEYRVRYLELSAYAADLIDRLMVGAPLGAAIISVCREHGQAPTQEFMESCASLLSNLAERGIIVGVSPTSACP
jgi:hypothetical protein